MGVGALVAEGGVEIAFLSLILDEPGQVDLFVAGVGLAHSGGGFCSGFLLSGVVDAQEALRLVLGHGRGAQVAGERALGVRRYALCDLRLHLVERLHFLYICRIRAFEVAVWGSGFGFGVGPNLAHLLLGCHERVVIIVISRAELGEEQFLGFFDLFFSD